MTKLHNVAPFQYRYFLVNRYNKARFGPFNSIEEAKGAVYENYRHFYYGSPMYSDVLALNTNERQDYAFARMLTSRSERNLKAPFVIMNHLGDIVPPDVIKSINKGDNRYLRRWENRQARAAKEAERRLWTKRNDDKLKKEYSVVRSNQHWSDYD